MGRAVGEGLKSYYRAKIEELEIQARDKQHNLRRLEAQRNDLNTKGALLASLRTVQQYSIVQGLHSVVKPDITDLRLDLCSEATSRRAAASSGAWIICGRSGQGIPPLPSLTPHTNFHPGVELHLL